MEPTDIVTARRQWQYRDLYGVPFEEFVKRLNDAGGQGWEAISVLSEGTQYRALLKRPAGAADDEQTGFNFPMVGGLGLVGAAVIVSLIYAVLWAGDAIGL
ncbi:MAG: hypothetical protein WD845_09905 [Pirellulales bacterium]